MARSQYSQGRPIIKDPLMGEPLVLVGFSFECINVYYRIFPQFPVYDNIHTRLPDFVIEIRDEEWKHLKDYVIECDGFAYHSSRNQVINDNRRTRFLSKHGYTVIRYMSDEINAMTDRFIINLENNIYHSIYKRDSPFYNRITS